jgi:ATP diphosphatase
MNDHDVFQRSMEIMRRLRNPQGGCPWDVEQTFSTIAPHTIEEAFEVAAAIESGDLNALREELGDLYFQVVFHSQMASELGQFDILDVIDGLNLKMVERHPHVFADSQIASSATQTDAWEALKARDREAAARAAGAPVSALDGVILPLPALTRAAKIQARAARVGFDWSKAEQVLDKVEEEICELRSALEGRERPSEVEEELGDVLFSLVNLARHLQVDAEGCLRRATQKFERRFRHLEQQFRDSHRELIGASLEEMEVAWAAAKAEEKSLNNK